MLPSHQEQNQYHGWVRAECQEHEHPASRQAVALFPEVREENKCGEGQGLKLGSLEMDKKKEWSSKECYFSTKALTFCC